MGFTVKQLDGSTWPDFERLFSKVSVAKSCWCMYYQRPQSFEREVREFGLTPSEIPAHNKRRKKELVANGRAHGILVYADGRAVGWCAYGPSEEFPRIDRGRYYRKLDIGTKEQETIWRITCFVVDRDFRKQGVAATALRAALASIKRQGGGVVEAYPVVSKKSGPTSMWFGTVRMFEHEGFKPVGPLGGSLLMRKVVR